MANTFFPNVGKIYAKHVVPVILNSNFTVAAADSQGYGVKNVTGAGIANVYMHTSTTPAAGNPNPANGFVMIKLQDNYNALLNATCQVTSPNSGSDVAVGGSALTAGQLYVISVVGTTTLAEWVAVGLPLGLTPTIGQAFIAIATGAGSGSGKVQVPKTAGSGISTVEVVGLVNTMNAPRIYQGAPSVIGGYVFLQCLGATDASTTTLIPKAPADGSIISVKLFLSNSSASAGSPGL